MMTTQPELAWRSAQLLPLILSHILLILPLKHVCRYAQTVTSLMAESVAKPAQSTMLIISLTLVNKTVQCLTLRTQILKLVFWPVQRAMPHPLVEPARTVVLHSRLLTIQRWVVSLSVTQVLQIRHCGLAFPAVLQELMLIHRHWLVFLAAQHNQIYGRILYWCSACRHALLTVTFAMKSWEYAVMVVQMTLQLLRRWFTMQILAHIIAFCNAQSPLILTRTTSLIFAPDCVLLEHLRVTLPNNVYRCVPILLFLHMHSIPPENVYKHVNQVMEIQYPKFV
jgi:hypothetical protein